jgi:hypothetical protein
MLKYSVKRLKSERREERKGGIPEFLNSIHFQLVLGQGGVTASIVHMAAPSSHEGAKEYLESRPNRQAV